MSKQHTSLKSRIKEQHKRPAWAPQGARVQRWSSNTTAPPLPSVDDISEKRSPSPRHLPKNEPEPAPETPSEEGGPDGPGWRGNFREVLGQHAFLGGIENAGEPETVSEKIPNRRPRWQPPSKTAQQSEPEPAPEPRPPRTPKRRNLSEKEKQAKKKEQKKKKKRAKGKGEKGKGEKGKNSSKQKKSKRSKRSKRHKRPKSRRRIRRTR